MNDRTIKLHEIAHARSGDKGNHANIGVIAYSKAGYEYLGKVLTEKLVAKYFSAMAPSKVVRFELPGIKAYNFLLHDVLAGGGSRSLRVDSQGKTLAIAILQMDIPRAENLDSMKRSV